MRSIGSSKIHLTATKKKEDQLLWSEKHLDDPSVEKYNHIDFDEHDYFTYTPYPYFTNNEDNLS